MQNIFQNELLTYYEDIEDLNDVLIRDIDQEPERPEGKVTRFGEFPFKFYQIRSLNTGPHRGLVPQLWANFTAPTEPPARNVSCAVARLKCAQRDGCGLALRNYFVGCSAILDGESGVCTTRCRYALIALMSTHEGKRLMKVRGRQLKAKIQGSTSHPKAFRVKKFLLMPFSAKMQTLKINNLSILIMNISFYVLFICNFL